MLPVGNPSEEAQPATTAHEQAEQAEEQEHPDAIHLQTHGYVVVPVPWLDEDEDKLKKIEEAFSTTVKNMPEFKSTKQDDVYTLGGFAALGTPSSFHNSCVRRLREWAMAELMPLFKSLTAGDPDINLEQDIDRMLYRPKGVQATAESWHRDEAKDAAGTDIIFGGWWNLNHQIDQSFSCVPGSHVGVAGNNGFATIKSADEKKACKAAAVTVRIPPGHIIIFYERIIHEVVAKKATATMCRLFLGWRLTYDTTPLIQDVKKRLQEKDVIPLKSAQYPPMYPTLHWTNWREKIVAFSEDVREEFKEDRTVRSGLDSGKTYHVVKRFMPSLTSALAELPDEYARPYKKREMDMHEPNRKWKLRRGNDNAKHEYTL